MAPRQVEFVSLEGQPPRGLDKANMKIIVRRSNKRHHESQPSVLDCTNESEHVS